MSLSPLRCVMGSHQHWLNELSAGRVHLTGSSNSAGTTGPFGIGWNPQDWAPITNYYNQQVIWGKVETYFCFLQCLQECFD